jgi:hypothetical protein
MNDRLLLRIATFAVVLFCRIAPALAEVPSGHEFENLLAVGPEGTTILFQGGTDKVFFSPTLKNRLRSSPELGTGFLKEKIMPYTLAEATFVSADVEGGRWRTISGIAGIAADTDGGHGILTLLQTFPRRYQHQGLRIARSALCRVDCGGFGERRSVPQVRVGKAVRI